MGETCVRSVRQGERGVDWWSEVRGLWSGLGRMKTRRLLRDGRGGMVGEGTIFWLGYLLDIGKVSRIETKGETHMSQLEIG